MRNSLEERNKITKTLKTFSLIEKGGIIIFIHSRIEKCHRNLMIVFIYMQRLLQSNMVLISTNVNQDGTNSICSQRSWVRKASVLQELINPTLDCQGR